MAMLRVFPWRSLNLRRSHNLGRFHNEYQNPPCVFLSGGVCRFGMKTQTSSSSFAIPDIPCDANTKSILSAMATIKQRLAVVEMNLSSLHESIKGFDLKFENLMKAAKAISTARAPMDARQGDERIPPDPTSNTTIDELRITHHRLKTDKELDDLCALHTNMIQEEWGNFYRNRDLINEAWRNIYEIAVHEMSEEQNVNKAESDLDVTALREKAGVTVPDYERFETFAHWTQLQDSLLQWLHRRAVSLVKNNIPVNPDEEFIPEDKKAYDSMLQYERRLQFHKTFSEYKFLT